MLYLMGANYLWLQYDGFIKLYFASQLHYFVIHYTN